MFFARVVILAAAAVTSVVATSVTIVNNCGDQIDPAIFPAADNGLGGFALSAGSQNTVSLPDGYSGRIWGREGCDSDGNCSSGQCSAGGVNCTGPSLTGPTIAQFTIDGFSSLDFFNPSVADGFNLVTTITPDSSCSTGAVSCTNAAGDGTGCGDTSTCATGTSYTVSFC
ncbi:Osmotin thaumatin-like protein [Stereum hirsutum FP-91666 SS1]|uniref:Osmotin thaumatin-like protein n=1 Tax=Stereum hirsutum (strain FP-91666) TaxID=721885 RepID=UPI000440C5C3|nr:Osmotin thaumatin-like protein [Stereum hirsutum FP-91666 SS1]EIM91870.1 Osmotin thaumatin-like protein [Stereum hirsutum FP-91666 SS1]